MPLADWLRRERTRIFWQLLVVLAFQLTAEVIWSSVYFRPIRRVKTVFLSDWLDRPIQIYVHMSCLCVSCGLASELCLYMNLFLIKCYCYDHDCYIISSLRGTTSQQSCSTLIDFLLWWLNILWTNSNVTARRSCAYISLNSESATNQLAQRTLPYLSKKEKNKMTSSKKKVHPSSAAPLSIVNNTNSLSALLAPLKAKDARSDAGTRIRCPAFPRSINWRGWVGAR